MAKYRPQRESSIGRKLYQQKKMERQAAALREQAKKLLLRQKKNRDIVTSENATVEILPPVEASQEPEGNTDHASD